MLPLALCLRRRAHVDDGTVPMSARDMADTLRMSPATLQVLLVIAGLACCIAMSMPQVHIVAYCADLGYGPARGAEMLSLMLGFGVVSRLASGLIADRIGGLGTLLLGSSLQCLAVLFYLPFDGLTPLYIVSALFGLSQGGIVPSYALIVRDYFPAREAGARVSLVLMATIVGMAAGRLAVGRHLRPHRLLRGRFPERHRLEPSQHVDRVLAAARPLPPAPRGRRPLKTAGATAGSGRLARRSEQSGWANSINPTRTAVPRKWSASLNGAGSITGDGPGRMPTSHWPSLIRRLRWEARISSCWRWRRTWSVATMTISRRSIAPIGRI